jgi:hypothetical protein
MNAVTITFLLLGGLGVVLLALAMFAGDLVPFGDGDGPLSMPSIAGFVGAFGFAGAAVASLTGGNALIALVVAVFAGVGVAVPAAWGTLALARAAGRMRTDATPTRTDLLGRLGVVVTPIPVEGYGEVRVIIGGQPVKLNAKSDHAVPLGARVFVVEAPSDTSVIVEETAPSNVTPD